MEDEREALFDRDLVPFIEAFEHESPDMVMAAHVIYPKLGDKKRPASLSRAVLRDLLRGELRYKGVVITDSMEMAGVGKVLPPGPAAVEAILAGNDLLLYAYDREMAAAGYKAVLEAVQRRTIPEDRISESLERILRLREGFKSRSWLSHEEAEEALEVSEESVFFDSAMQALVLEGNAGVLGEIPGHPGPKLIVLPRDLGERRRLNLDMVREQLGPAGFELVETAAEPTPEETAAAEEKAAEAAVIVVGTASRGPMKPGAQKMVQALTRRDVIKVGVALLDPDDADLMMGANCRIKTFGCAVPQLWAMCQKLLG
jgi:beta-N-acetylhexosaminidase